MLNGGGRLEPHRHLDLSLLARWVAEAQLDNTGNSGLPHAVLLQPRRARGDRPVARSWAKRGEPRLRVQVTNLLDDDRIWPAGYSYLYFVRGADGRDALFGTSYYYPLATRSVYVTLDVRF